MTVHVGVVARCLNTEHTRGMGRYVREVLRHGAADPAFTWTVFGNDEDQPMRVPAALASGVDVFPFRGDRFELWEQLGLPRRAVRRAVQVIHCTEGSLCWWQPVPTVVTVHDTLAWKERPDTVKDSLYWDHLQSAALRRCAAIITISQSSRRDIEARWPEVAHKVTVIPHGVGDEYLDPADDPTPSELQGGLGDTPYAVYLGGPLPRKRFDWAVRVLLASELSQLRLVACGFGAKAAESMRQAMPAEALSRVLFAPFLSDGQLRALYRGARAVLYPTLYEGFGFPALEAQASGAPVLFSPVSSLTDLVGPLSFTAAPGDLDAWVANLRRACAAVGRPVGPVSDAKHWARGFSWRASYEAHAQVYRQAAAHRGAAQQVPAGRNRDPGACHP
jgi:glycosyltransferase involved in cell wall biosynthesis